MLSSSRIDHVRWFVTYVADVLCRTQRAIGWAFGCTETFPRTTLRCVRDVIGSLTYRRSLVVGWVALMIKMAICGGEFAVDCDCLRLSFGSMAQTMPIWDILRSSTSWKNNIFNFLLAQKIEVVAKFLFMCGN